MCNRCSIALLRVAIWPALATCVQAAHTRSNGKKTLDGSPPLFHRKSFHLQSFIIEQIKALGLLSSLGSSVAASTSGFRVKNHIVHTLHLRHDIGSATSTRTLWDSGYSHGRYNSSHDFPPPKKQPRRIKRPSLRLLSMKGCQAV